MGKIARYYNKIVMVNTLADFPAPVSNVITLAANTMYEIVNAVDLGSNRLVCSQNTFITGLNSEISSLTATLGSGVAMITSNWSIPIENITLSVSGAGAKILDLDASANAGSAIDWENVNFNGGIIGTIIGYSNAIFTECAVLNASGGFTFDGTIGTIAFSETLFSGLTAGTYITLPVTANITRRIRVVYSSIVVTTGNGIDVSTSATIPTEGFILDTVNFSGGGTYLAGLTYTSDKSLFTNCRGITNTTAVGYYTMLNNATATTILAVDTPVKVAGTTTNSSITNKFTHSNNRLTYTGALTRVFEVSAIMTVTSTANNEIGLYIAKNGTVITESETYLTANAGGKFENGAIQCLTELATNDYIEIFVENATGANNITVEFLSVTVQAEV